MRFIKLMLLFIAVVFLTSLSAEKIHVSNLPVDFSTAFIPDMDGYINISDSPTSLGSILNHTRTLPQVMQGFPLSYTSSNTYNGAVFVNLDDDAELEILFGVGKKIVAFNTDGTLVTGWPVTMPLYVWGSPAIGDIDGDGEEEIVCTSRNSTNGNTGNLHAFHKNGSIVAGFPVTQTGGGTMNACLADITGDEALEILLNIRNAPNGWTTVYDGAGQIVPGWPQQLDTFPGAGISAGDINNDGEIEVISLSYNSLFVFNNDGTVAEGFPVSFPGFTFSYSSPVLFDLDNNGFKEIIFGGCGASTGAVFVVNHDGSVRTGWPQATSSWIFATVALADLDNNNEYDIVVGDQTSSSTPANYIYAWDKDGNSLNGFPSGPYWAIYSQVCISDIDGDNSTDIIFTSNLFTGGLDAINSDGSHKSEWPLPVGADASAVTMMSTPVIGDFNQDGMIELAGASTGFSSWLVELYLWSTGTPVNENLAYMTLNGCNVRHDGVYQHNNIPGPLFPPDEINILVNENDACLQWSYSHPESSITGFNIYRDNVLITPNPLPVSNNNFYDNDLVPGMYHYDLKAVYPNGESSPLSSIALINNPEGIWFPTGEDFQYNFPASYWVNLDADDDGNRWFQEGPENNRYITSSSLGIDGSLLTPNDWIISPKIIFNVENVSSFSAEMFLLAQTDAPADQPQSLSILVSHTDNQPSSFTEISNLTISNGSWQVYPISITFVIAPEFYIAFRHHHENPLSSKISIDSVMVYIMVGNQDHQNVSPQIHAIKNYPNPFNPETTIQYTLNEKSNVTIEIFNVKGQKIKTLLNEFKDRGSYSILWNGRDEQNNSVGSGIYYYQMKSGKYTSTGKMILLK